MSTALAKYEPEQREVVGAVALSDPQPVGLFGVSEPVAIVQKAKVVAETLKDVITQQGLISNIGGKQYPRCEAWTLLGTLLGVNPVLVWSRPVEGGWEARVEARTRGGATVGAAEAQCLKSERNWSNRDDFALRSMAQTRATAKCLRMPLGFVMTLAGYEPTPAEEMTHEEPAAAAPPKREQPRQPATGTDGKMHAFEVMRLATKTGTKKNGEEWTRYGVLLKDEGGTEAWANSFHESTATLKAGDKILAQLEFTDKGINLLSWEPNRESDDVPMP